MGMSGGGGGGRGRAPMGEINVTPLVDVMLVLLIIFMVAAPMLTTGVEVDLPKTTAERMEQEPEKLVLSIDDEQNVWLGETMVPADRLEEALLNNARVQSDDEIYVYADASVPYGFVVRVFSTIKRAGVETLGLITDPAGGAFETTVAEETQ